jgi:uncharacterized protein DUF4190
MIDCPCGDRFAATYPTEGPMVDSSTEGSIVDEPNAKGSESKDPKRKPTTDMPTWPEEQPGGGRVGAARNGMPIASLSTGALSLISILLLKSLPIAIVLAVVAVVLGFIGMRQVKKGIADRRGFALAGLILGVVGIVLSVVLLILSYRVYNDCKHKIGHSPSQKELTKCVDDKKK